MRTRKSNRGKRFIPQTYDLEGSEEEEEGSAQHAQSEEADDEDQNFAVSDHESQVDPDEDDDDEDDKGLVVGSDSDSDASSDNLDAVDRSPRRRQTAQAKREAIAARQAAKTQYLSIDPVPTDSHLPRGYAGYFDRNVRGPNLLRAWYGPEDKKFEIAMRLVSRWAEYSLLPPRETVPAPTDAREGVWSHDIFQRESALVEGWIQRLDQDASSATKLSALPVRGAKPYRLDPGTLPVLVGPSNSPSEIRLSVGESVSISQSGMPLKKDENPATISSGWILDAGGIVLDLSWAAGRTGDATQLLAMAVIPHSDQESYNYEEKAAEPGFQKYGVVQIWEFEGKKTKENTMLPSAAPAKIHKTLCFEGGRPRKVKWNPACSHLAILSSNGTAFVFDPKVANSATHGETKASNRRASSTAAKVERLEKPIASFSLVEEEGIKATAMAWVNVNRLSIGYSDGSIALWSVYPHCLVARHPIHHAPVIDMASGYPTLPYLIASNPMGGFSKLIDLRAPSYEATEVPSISITLTSNVLSWSDHLLGFFSITPTSNVLNTMVGFMHSSHFPIARRVFTAERLVSCLAVGRTHPFLLIGCVDGSLWALNSQYELIHAKRELTDRIKIFQHEHRPASCFPSDSPAAERGVSRIVQGYVPEKNQHARSADTKQGKKKKSRKDEDEVVDGDGDETTGPSDPTKGIVHEPLTRITAVEWNPNEGYGCWAAIALGSGLVRVIDLGLDH